MILVTGGLGYIGSHTVVELLSVGKSVLILDNLSNSDLVILERIKEIAEAEPVFVQGDIRDEGLLNRLFQEYEITSVVHFAGLKAVGESVEIPLTYYDNNINGTLTLLKVMQAHKVKKMVFSSSATVYGNSANVPFIESETLSTTNPYGATKRMIEEILQDLYVSDHTWSIVLLRYFNPIGAHKSGLIGENPKGIPNNLLPYVARVAAGTLKELQVFGDDYDTPDGTGVRDYIHVVDLAIGHLKALEYIEDKSCIEAVNLGRGKGYSVLEVIKAFEEASGHPVPYKVVGRRSGDIATCFASVAKARDLLGFTAQRDIMEMCEDAWRFMMKGVES